MAQGSLEKLRYVPTTAPAPSPPHWVEIIFLLLWFCIYHQYCSDNPCSPSISKRCWPCWFRRKHLDGGMCQTSPPWEERKERAVAVISSHNGGQSVFTLAGSYNPCEQHSPHWLTLMVTSISIHMKSQRGIVCGWHSQLCANAETHVRRIKLPPCLFLFVSKSYWIVQRSMCVQCSLLCLGHQLQKCFQTTHTLFLLAEQIWVHLNRIPFGPVTLHKTYVVACKLRTEVPDCHHSDGKHLYVLSRSDLKDLPDIWIANFFNRQLFGVKKASDDAGHCLASTVQAAVLHPWTGGRLDWWAGGESVGGFHFTGTLQVTLQ